MSSSRTAPRKYLGIRSHEGHDKCRVSISINVLPDDVLVHIFRFDRLTFLAKLDFFDRVWDPPWRWQRLVHVCRRWRSVIFASPKSLNLKLVCPFDTSAEPTGVWPPLPIVIRALWPIPEDYDFDVAIVHPNRVCEIDLVLSNWVLEQLVSAMQEPFPALTQFRLHFDRDRSLGPAPFLPDGFLGASASRLRYLKLDRIPFPGLPILLLSATHLVTLHLWRIPRSTSLSPAAMVTCLSVLTSLEIFVLGFISDNDYSASNYDFLDWETEDETDESSDQESLHSPLPAHTDSAVLPALTHFEFKGLSNYLEDLVVRIIAPRLFYFSVTLFAPIDFDTPHLVQFISRTHLGAPEKVCVTFDRDTVRVRISSQTPGSGMFDVGILCKKLDQQLLSLVQVCTSCLPPLFAVENLYTSEDRCYAVSWQADTINLLWLDFLQLFASVKNLYISENAVSSIALALQHPVGGSLGRTTQVLPNLQNLFLEGLQPSGPVQKGIEQFVKARQLSSNPIAISIWGGKSNSERLMIGTSVATESSP